jgi:hypothetical protein
LLQARVARNLPFSLLEIFVASTPDMYALLGCARRAAAELLEAPPSDLQLHQRLAYSLHGPKQLWRSAAEGIVSHDQAAAMVLADLVSWLQERGGRSEPSSKPLIVTTLIPEIEAALFGEWKAPAAGVAFAKAGG